MPVMSKKVGSKWRVIEASTKKIAKNRAGTALDGGGFYSHEQCVSQVQAVNMALRRRRRRA